MANIRDIVISMIQDGKSKHPSRLVTTRIINKFLSTALDEILEGNTVVLPGEIGEIKVNKYIQDKLPPISKAKFYTEGKKERATNMSTLGYYFAIDCKSALLDRYGVDFKASHKFRKKLSNKLRSGYDNYSMSWTQRKSQ